MKNYTHKIIISETQYKRLFLNEQSSWTWWDQLGADVSYIWRDVKRAFGESGDIPANFYKLGQYVTDGDQWAIVGGSWMDNVINPVYTWGKDCFGEMSEGNFHCTLDVLSIIALVIPWPAGLLVSGGIDLVNMAYYTIEASPLVQDDGEWNWGLLSAGALTGIGIIPAAKFLKGAKISKPAIQAAEGYIKELQIATTQGKNSAKLNTKMMSDLEKKYFSSLSAAEKTKVQNLIKTMGSAEGKKIIQNYTKSLELLKSKWGPKLLSKVGSNKTFKKIMLENGGDVVKSMKIFKGKAAFKDFLIQSGLFIGISASLPPILRWYGRNGWMGPEHMVYLTQPSGGRTTPYLWEEEIKLQVHTKTDEDEEKFIEAWLSGWRPRVCEGDYVFSLPLKYQSNEYKKFKKEHEHAFKFSPEYQEQVSIKHEINNLDRNTLMADLEALMNDPDYVELTDEEYMDKVNNQEYIDQFKSTKNLTKKKKGNLLSTVLKTGGNEPWKNTEKTTKRYYGDPEKNPWLRGGETTTTKTTTTTTDGDKPWITQKNDKTKEKVTDKPWIK